MQPPWRGVYVTHVDLAFPVSAFPVSPRTIPGRSRLRLVFDSLSPDAVVTRCRVARGPPHQRCSVRRLTPPELAVPPASSDSCRAHPRRSRTRGSHASGSARQELQSERRRFIRSYQLHLWMHASSLSSSPRCPASRRRKAPRPVSIAMGSAERVTSELSRQLSRLGTSAQPEVCGHGRIGIGRRRVVGFAVRVRGLSPEESLRLQVAASVGNDAWVAASFARLRCSDDPDTPSRQVLAEP